MLLPNIVLNWFCQSWSALGARCMRPVGVSVSGHVALCLGLRQAVKGRGCAKRAVSVPLGSTWVTPENVWRLTCAPACMMDSSTSLMTSTQITTASGQWLCVWRNNAECKKPKDIVFHRYTLDFWCFYFLVCVATVKMAPCAVAPLKWALHCLTSSMMMTWHHPEVQFQYFARALLIVCAFNESVFVWPICICRPRMHWTTLTGSVCFWLQCVSCLVTLKNP